MKRDAMSGPYCNASGTPKPAIPAPPAACAAAVPAPAAVVAALPAPPAAAGAAPAAAPPPNAPSALAPPSANGAATASSCASVQPVGCAACQSAPLTHELCSPELSRGSSVPHTYPGRAAGLIA